MANAILSFSLTDGSYTVNMVLSYKATAEKVTLSFGRKAVVPTPTKDFSARSKKKLSRW
jgi:hypothetical protein